MKKPLLFAAALALFTLPVHAFASTFTFSTGARAANTYYASDNFYTDTSDSICSKNLATWNTNANQQVPQRTDIANTGGNAIVTDNASDSTVADYFNGVNGLGPTTSVNNIDTVQTGQLVSPFIDLNGKRSTPNYPGIPETNGVAAVPEPLSMILLGTGLTGLYVRRRRQQN